MCKLTEGNAHSLRLLASLEMYCNRGGMRLTAATIGTLLKYPWTTLAPDGRRKIQYSIKPSWPISAAWRRIGPARARARPLGAPPFVLFDGSGRRYLLCLARFGRRGGNRLAGRCRSGKHLAELTFVETTWHAQSSRQRCAMLRGIAIGRAIDDVAQTFMTHQSDLLNGRFQGKDFLSLCSPEVRNTLEKAKEFGAHAHFPPPKQADDRNRLVSLLGLDTRFAGARRTCADNRRAGERAPIAGT